MTLLLVACSVGGDNGQEKTATLLPGESLVHGLSTVEPAADAAPTASSVDLTLTENDITISPMPVRAGFPYSLTATIHNNSLVPAVDVPVMVYMSALQEEIGHTPFVEILTVTIEATQSLAVEIPIVWNFVGGEHQLWVQANRLPDAWQLRTPTLPEDEIGDNIVLLDLMVDPFDAYASDLCAGRTDVEVGPTDVLPEPDQQRVRVRVHNIGNRAVYNLPIVVLGDDLTGIAYTPMIPPCGGAVELVVDVDRTFEQGESLTVRINPAEWDGSLAEDDFANNQVTVAAGLAPGVEMPLGTELDEYDFSIATADIEIPEMWIVLVKAQNLGTRDADMVPIRIENENGRKITDAIPLIQGNGQGVAAFRVGYLWIRGGTLTFTINPEDAKGAYPETNRDNNTATFTLP